MPINRLSKPLSRQKKSFAKPFSKTVTFYGFQKGLLQGALIISFAILAVLPILSPQLSTGVRAHINDAVLPIFSALTSPIRQLSSAISDVSGLSVLRAENAILQQENIRLKEWYQTALMLQAENQSLQELLNLKELPKHHFITARIVADTHNLFLKTLLVRAGAQDGVKKNQAVLSGDGMIGRIIEAGGSLSRVLLLTDLLSLIHI